MSTTDLILRAPNAAPNGAAKKAAMRAAKRAVKKDIRKATKKAERKPRRKIQLRRRRMAGKPKASPTVNKPASKPVNRPASLVKKPTSPVKKPASPVKKTASPVKKPVSPPAAKKMFLPKTEYERILRTYQPGAPPLTPKAYEFLDGIIVKDVLGPLARSSWAAPKGFRAEGQDRFGNSIHTSRRMLIVGLKGIETTGFPFYLARPKDRAVYRAVGAWFTGRMSSDLQAYYKPIRSAGKSAWWKIDKNFQLKCAAVVSEFIDEIFTRMVKKGWDHYYANPNSIAPSTGIGSKIKAYMDYKASWFGRHPEPQYHITRRNLHHGLRNVDGDDANFQAVFKSVFGARTNANLNAKTQKFLQELVQKMGPRTKPFVRA